MDNQRTKLTLNRLIDIIDNLPDEKRSQEKIQKLKQSLLDIKFDKKNKGFAGKIIIDNSESLIAILINILHT